MVLGSKKKISGCSLFPVHVRCYGWRHVNVSYQVPCQCPTSFSVSSSLPTVFATMNWTRKFNKTTKNKHYLSDRSRSLTWRLCPPLVLEARICQFTGPCLEKRTTLPSFRNVTLAEHVQQKTTQPALKKRWTTATGLGCRKFLSTLFACSKTPGLQRWPDILFIFISNISVVLQ